MADDEMLREMARHRGFRLVRSRRRKPGSGDYGRYGLTDAAGKKCFGFAKSGLTATAEQIESYLRSVESASWRRSIGAARAAPPRAKPKARAAAEPTTEPPKRPARKIEPRSRVRPEAKTRRSRPVAAPPLRKTPPPKPAAPPPVLRIREATASDAAAIDRLLRSLRPAPGAAGARARLGDLLSAGEPPLIADRGGVIGCVAWHIIPTLQRGKIGRITLILVAAAERRQGIGRGLIDAAEARLRKAGCKTIEAISDIAIVNAHGFFRSLGYEQASYRFTRPAKAR